MGVDYVVKGECSTKKKLGEAKLIEMLKLMSMVLALKKLEGKNMSPAEFANMSFTHRVLTKKGYEDRELSVGSVLNEVSQLDKHEESCKGCKYNSGEHGRGVESPFGCIGGINYPISAIAEEALLHTAMVIGNNDDYMKEFGLILKYIKDHPDIGKRVKSMRESPNGRNFFECPDNLWIEPKGEVFYSNQILEVLFGYEVEPSYAKAIYIPFFEVFHSVFTKSKKAEEYKADACTSQIMVFGSAFLISAKESVPIEIRM
jgi:hypothetical protein